MDGVDGTGGDAGEIDDDIFTEFTLFESLDPWETIGEINGFVDSIFFGFVEGTELEFELFEPGFGDLLNLSEEIEDVLEEFVGDLGAFEFLFFLEFGSESFKPLPYLDAMDERKNLFFGEATIEILERLSETILEIGFIFFFEDSGRYFHCGVFFRNFARCILFFS